MINCLYTIIYRFIQNCIQFYISALEKDMMIDPCEFINALEQFPTGVCIVTTPTYNVSSVGVTISSFNSVSLEPPLILWSLTTNSELRPLFRDNPGLVVNVLAAGSEDLAMRFAGSRDRNVSDLNIEHVDNIGARFCESLVSFDRLTHQIVEAATTIYSSGLFRILNNGVTTMRWTFQSENSVSF